MLSKQWFEPSGLLRHGKESSLQLFGGVFPVYVVLCILCSHRSFPVLNREYFHKGTNFVVLTAK